MPNLPKSRNASAKSAKKGKKSSGGRKSSAKKNKVAPQTLSTIDILSPAAMENLYYIAHNSPDALTMRGFGYTGPKVKKKKGGKKGKKKKK
ncbi:hypothetical protein EB796_003977 [Bugula neritina]|uniref:Uncharacterized protein n=1 Tax=Bugula neritina TaxID=10212 RepID=A0A7J7KHG9_BUGNE|nr:hypothetical protein EB796_003977 [Bugula neritina]